MREVNGHQFQTMFTQPMRVPRTPGKAAPPNPHRRDNWAPVQAPPTEINKVPRRAEARGVRPEAQYRAENAEMRGQLAMVLSDRFGWKV